MSVSFFSWEATFSFTVKVFFFLVVRAGCNFTTQCFTNSLSVPPQHCSYYSDNKKASVMFYKTGCVFLICQWLRPLKDFILAFGWAMKGSQTSIWLSRIRRKSHIPGVYHFPHTPNILTLFVWCRYWVSSEKSGLRSRRMAASICWAGIGMLYGTNASGLAWTSWQYNFTLFFFSPSPSLYVSLSLSQ